MKQILCKAIRFLPVFLAVLFYSEQAMATQMHGGIEGVIVHQMAHIIFVGAMALLIYWLRQHGLVVNPGWRLIQYAAIFFLLWNINAFVVHFLEEQVDILDMAQIEPWQLRLQAQPGFEWSVWLYYVVKLDHLLCVPAMICLYSGLKRLLEAPVSESRPGKMEGS